ncbi:hypothetical protein [Psychromonas hadalis]|uniref:hypothetical protein n=1 Tax=Psychromonas hadalis TaxID=211669 RepID=UPI000400D54C
MFKPRLKNYPENCAPTIPTPEFSSLVDLFENSFQHYAKECAFISMDKNLTYQ